MLTNKSQSTVKSVDAEQHTVTLVKYFGSLVTSEGDSEAGVSNRIIVEWMKWMEASGVIKCAIERFPWN